MNPRTTFRSLAQKLASSAVPRHVSAVNVAELLGWAGLRTYRSRASAKSIYLVSGVLLGAVAALLLTPESGRQLRQRIGKRVGGAAGQQIGKVVGEQFGSHPVRTAKLVKTAQELLGPRE